ncbi:hypothetical protein [Maribacter polysaccharolyticus]|nr:hypothetical protein [Maribacter polysaccharolyticus]MDE3744106.1 hypothetical protein [Maribacter polysaccharolyticus]
MKINIFSTSLLILGAALILSRAMVQPIGRRSVFGGFSKERLPYDL